MKVLFSSEKLAELLQSSDPSVHKIVAVDIEYVCVPHPGTEHPVFFAVAKAQLAENTGGGPVVVEDRIVYGCPHPPGCPIENYLELLDNQSFLAFQLSENFTLNP